MHKERPKARLKKEKKEEKRRKKKRKKEEERIVSASKISNKIEKS